MNPRKRPNFKSPSPTWNRRIKLAKQMKRPTSAPQMNFKEKRQIKIAQIKTKILENENNPKLKLQQTLKYYMQNSHSSNIEKALKKFDLSAKKTSSSFNKQTIKGRKRLNTISNLYLSHQQKKQQQEKAKKTKEKQFNKRLSERNCLRKYDTFFNFGKDFRRFQIYNFRGEKKMDKEIEQVAKKSPEKNKNKQYFDDQQDEKKPKKKISTIRKRKKHPYFEVYSAGQEQGLIHFQQQQKFQIEVNPKNLRPKTDDSDIINIINKLTANSNQQKQQQQGQEQSSNAKNFLSLFLNMKK